MSDLKDGQWCPLAAASEFGSEDVIGCQAGERDIALYRVGDDFYATSNICTHALALLSDGLLEGHEIECPIHNGRFDIRTGKALTSPVEIDLETYRTRVSDGQVEVFIPS